MYLVTTVLKQSLVPNALVLVEDLEEKKEIRLTAAGNREHFAFNIILKSRLVSQSMNFRLYDTLIRPAMAFHSETWTLDRFETKLLRGITCSTRESGIWQRNKNTEWHVVYEELSITFIRMQRLKWLGLKDGRRQDSSKTVQAFSWWRGWPCISGGDSILSNIKQLRVNISLGQD